MKQKIKRISILLFLLTLLFTGCKSDPAETTGEPPAVGGEETQEKSQYDVLLEPLRDTNYEGRKFRIATDNTSLVFPKNSNGITGKEYLLRNRAIEQKYNVQITLTDESGLPTITERIRSEALAGTDYCDLVILESKSFQTLASSDSLLNIRSIPYLDFDASGVYETSLSATTLGNYTYGFSGKFNLNPENLFCVFFNKTLLSQSNLPNIYQLANSGQWDFENFLLYGEELYSLGRVNGVKVYGFTSTETKETLVNLLWAAGGNRFLSNEYGTRPKLDYLNDNTKDFIDQAKDLLSRSNAFQNQPNSALDLFLNGGSLFLIAPLSSAEEIAAKGINWGVVPLPKQNINQANFYSYQNGLQTYCGFAKGTPDLAFSADVTNAFFASSVTLSENNFITQYLNLYLNSSDDALMLKKILATPYFDPAEFFSQMDSSISASTQILLNRVVSNEGNLEVLYAQYEKMLNQFLNQKL